jgi:hypothetical protein
MFVPHILNMVVMLDKVDNDMVGMVNNNEDNEDEEDDIRML